jgi:hypothetical protein
MSEKRAKKLAQNYIDPKLANADMADSLGRIADELEKPKEVVKELKVEITNQPEIQKFKLEGVEVVTFKGDRGEVGPQGERGEKGDSITGPQGPKGEKGDAGYTPIKGVDYFDGEKGEQGETGVGLPGKNGSPDSPEQIVEKINSLPDEDEFKIDASHIKGLPEIKDGKGQAVFSVERGGLKVYDLSSSLDGATKTFSLPAFDKIIMISSTSFPFTFRPTVDYTSDASAMTLTFTSEITASTTLALGQTLLIVYSVL